MRGRRGCLLDDWDSGLGGLSVVVLYAYALDYYACNAVFKLQETFRGGDLSYSVRQTYPARFGHCSKGLRTGSHETLHLRKSFCAIALDRNLIASGKS